LYHCLVKIAGEGIIRGTMSGIYKGPATPPGEYYPYTDIGIDIVSPLQLLIQDEEQLDALHATVDDIYPVYRLGHKALESFALHLQYDDIARLSYLHGVTAYEVTASIIRPWAPRYSIESAMANIAAFHDLVDTPDIITYEVTEALEKLHTQQPNLVTMIEASSGLLSPDYVLQGAACARAIETSIIESATRNH
jgi:hypothetical protein